MKNLYNIIVLIVLLFTSQSSNSQDDILKKINEIATPHIQVDMNVSINKTTLNEISFIKCFLKILL